MKSTPWIVIGLLLVLGTALMLLGAVYLFVFPKVYKSTALIRISPDGVEKFREEVQSTGYGYGFNANPWEQLLSKAVLFQVISNLNLHLKWTDEQKQEAPFTIETAYPLLRDRLKISQHRNTSLVSVSAHSANPTEPGIIANEIASVFRLQRESDRAAIIAGYLERMKEKRSSLDKQIQEVNARLDTAETRLLKQQLQSARQQIDSDIAAATQPQPPIVQIIDQAVQPTAPIRPNRILGSAVLVIGGGFELAAFLMLLQCRLVPRSPSA